MKRFLSIIAFGLAATLGGPPAFAGPDCTLLQASKPEEARLKVYFTKFLKEDTSGGKYKSCRIVKKVEAGTVTYFVTPFRQDATVVVHETNWPR